MVVSAALGAVLTGCSIIDEDLSKCDEPQPQPQPEPEYKIDYELQLITNISTEIETELSAPTDTAIANALRRHLSTIFTDRAYDVDLSFYDTQADSVRLQHDQHIMDASQASYSLNLPKRQYMHLAAANLVNNGQVSILDDNWCHRSQLQQVSGDTIPSHTTGLFTARLPMNVLEGVDQQFSVRLYMANCATALVIDDQGYDTSGLRVFATGFATDYSICDSLYRFAAQAPVVRAASVQPATGSKLAYCAVTFPSREPVTTRTVIQTVDPFIAQPGEQSVWDFVVLATGADGTVTRTVLGIKEPLRAGELKIVKVKLMDNGSLSPESSEVSVSVALDWKEGNTYHPNS